MFDKRILIIDDEPAIRSVVHLCLNEINAYEVIEAESGQMGLIKAVEEQPDAIILDISMPEMDGLEVLRRLKSSHITCHIPVVILSAIVTMIDKSQFSQYDVVQMILKPFDPLTLGEQIAAACRWI